MKTTGPRRTQLERDLFTVWLYATMAQADVDTSSGGLEDAHHEGWLQFLVRPGWAYRRRWEPSDGPAYRALPGIEFAATRVRWRCSCGWKSRALPWSPWTGEPDPDQAARIRAAWACHVIPVATFVAVGVSARRERRWRSEHPEEIEALWRWAARGVDEMSRYARRQPLPEGGNG